MSRALRYVVVHCPWKSAEQWAVRRNVVTTPARPALAAYWSREAAQADCDARNTKPVAKRVFKTHRLEYWQGGRTHSLTVPRSHYDLAVAYLRRGNPRASIADVDEVIIDFPEEELRAILARPRVPPLPRK